MLVAYVFKISKLGEAFVNIMVCFYLCVCAPHF